MTHEFVAERTDMSDVDFRALADSIPHILWTALPDGSTDYFNRRGMEYTGLPQTRLFDPQVVDACVQLFAEGHFQLEQP